MNDVVLEFREVTKRFRLYRTHKTLFRFARALWQRLELSKELLALDRVNFKVRRGEKVALLGLNGSGKTTLLRTACGILTHYSGEIVRREPFFPLFNYRLGLSPELSVMDNIFLFGAFHGMSSQQVENRLEAILDFCELQPFLNLPVRHLSTGQLARLGFAVFMQAGHEFLVFDESTSFGDIVFQRRVAAYFDSLFGDPAKTVLMTSHDLEALARHCRRALWLERGRIKADGDAQEIIREYRRLHAAPKPPPAAPTAQQVWSGETENYFLTSRHQQMLLDQLVWTAADFVRKVPALAAGGREEDIRCWVFEFYELYGSRPVAVNKNGIGFHGSFWLFITARCLGPSLIVESGVLQGHSSWVLRQACAEALLHLFDPRLDRLVWQDPRAVYHAQDWGNFDFGVVPPEKSLVFFDCHIDQCRRIREAHAKGFRYLVFDDNVPLLKMRKTADPPWPTLHMMMHGGGVSGERVAWVHKGIRREKIYDDSLFSEVRSLIDTLSTFPSLAEATGFDGHSHMSFVALKS